MTVNRKSTPMASSKAASTSTEITFLVPQLTEKRPYLSKQP
jgi:hypothetical protein